MPLKDFPANQGEKNTYVHRERLYVSAHTAESNLFNTKTFTVSDYQTIVDQAPQNVTSLELTNYIMPRTYATPFPYASSTSHGARYLDIRVEDVANPAVFLDFSIEMPNKVLYNTELTLEKFTQDLTDTYQYYRSTTGIAVPDMSFRWMDDQEFPSGQYGALLIYAIDDPVPVSSSANVYFLFASGPNADNSPWRELGFPTQADVGGYQMLPSGLEVRYPVPSTRLNFWRDRYVEINIDQIPELEPFARVFVTSKEDYSNNSEEPTDDVRLLSNPPRFIDKLTVRLRMNQGRPINPRSIDVHSLTLDALCVVPNVTVPNWIQQNLEY